MNTQFDTMQHKKQNGFQIAIKDRQAEVLEKSQFQPFSTKQLQSDFAFPSVRERLTPASAPAAHQSTFQHDFNHIPVHTATMANRAAGSPPPCNAHPAIQTKLAINQPGDKYEQEAERVAKQIVHMPFPDSRLREPPSGQVPTTFLNIQRKAATYMAQADPPSVVQEILSTPGSPLDRSTRGFMENRFGYDFEAIRIHTGPKAAEAARAVNALAFTVGQRMVFAAGQFTPGTFGGKRLIAHELAHTIQQPRSSKFLFRLIRSPYPWRGVITPAIGANLRSAPDSSDPSNILFAIPQGETVRVLSATGNWLRVESRYRGPVEVGYIYHTLVDDASSRSMASSVGSIMVWRPSGPGSGTDFESWASAPTETPFPAVTATTVMNCWEAVLLAAYRAGAIDWNWIHNLYVSTPVADWVSTMSRGARHTYSIPGPNPRMPQRGDLVFFNGLAHVALATGNGSEVYTFWPPPNTPFTAGGTTDKVKVFTIEDLVVWWELHMPPRPTVEFAAPAW